MGHRGALELLWQLAADLEAYRMELRQAWRLGPRCPHGVAGAQVCVSISSAPSGGSPGAG